jgi:hypothetical protein
MDMVRFSNVQDPGYQAVRGEIRRWLKGIQNRRDAERLPEVVGNVSTDESIYQPQPHRIEPTAHTVYEPTKPHPYSNNSQHQDSTLQQTLYHPELAQPYSHTYPSNHAQSYPPIQPAYHDQYTYSNNQGQDHRPQQHSYWQPRAHPHEYNQQYASVEPAHHYPRDSASGRYEEHVRYEPASRDPRTYGNTQTHDASPHPRREDRGQGSVYQESSYFGETDNKNGKMLQGNYNVTGNISF